MKESGLEFRRKKPGKRLIWKPISIETVLTQYQSLQTEEKADETMVVAGRIMAKRGHGKTLVLIFILIG